MGAPPTPGLMDLPQSGYMGGSPNLIGRAGIDFSNFPGAQRGLPQMGPGRQMLGQGLGRPPIGAGY
jgi:hypothetical protein